MMKQFNLKTGQIGEKIAKEFLEKNGYKTLEQNHKTKYGEIDLICQKGKELVIVEVRTKRGDLYGTPEDSLNKKKLRKIWLNAIAYTNQKGWKGPYRVDAVCIVLAKSWHKVPERLEHYQNVV